MGYQTAEALAKQGHKVYGAARRVDRMEPLKASGVVPVKMDVTDEASIEAGLKEIIAAEGRIDVLINNAGLQRPVPEDRVCNDRLLSGGLF